MGAMSMKFVGTVEVAEKDADVHRALCGVKSKEAAGGQGHADADVVFQLEEGGGRSTRKHRSRVSRASMGRG